MKALAFLVLLPKLAFGQFVPPANDLPGDATVEGNHTVKGTSDLQGAVSNSTGDVTISDNLALSGTFKLTGTGTNTATSATSAANASATVGAFTLKPTATLDANDLVLDIQSAASAHLLKLDLEGDATFAGGVSSTTASHSGTITSTVASGSTAASLLAGARLVFGAATAYLYDDGTYLRTPYNFYVEGAASFRDGLVAFNGGGANFYAGAGSFHPLTAFGGGGIMVRGNNTDGAGATNVVIDTTDTLTGGKILQIKNNTVEKTGFAYDGAMSSTSTRMRGTITMSSGSGTATVLSGAICVCNDTSSVLSCKPSVSSTTLTVTVTAGGSDVVSYICVQ